MSYFMVEEDQEEQGLNYVMVNKADIESGVWWKLRNGEQSGYRKWSLMKIT
jgi:hypothetical protein